MTVIEFLTISMGHSKVFMNLNWLLTLIGPLTSLNSIESS